MGTYTGAAHCIHSIRNAIPKEIPKILHIGSSCNFDLMVKHLSQSRVIKFYQKECLRTSVEIHKNSENNFEKKLSKVMKNSVLSKTIEILWRNRYIFSL